MSKIEEFLQSANAVSEEELNVIFEKIMMPIDDAREMGKTFTWCIGYNPITYYTELAASDVFYYLGEMIRDDFPKTFSALTDAEEPIIKELLERTEETRAQYAYFGIKGKIRNIMKNTNEMNNEKIDEVFEFLDSKFVVHNDKKVKNNSSGDDTITKSRSKDVAITHGHEKTSFKCTQSHPISVVDGPSKEELDEMDEIYMHEKDSKYDLNDSDFDDELIFPDDEDDEDDDEYEEDLYSSDDGIEIPRNDIWK